MAFPRLNLLLRGTCTSPARRWCSSRSLPAEGPSTRAGPSTSPTACAPPSTCRWRSSASSSSACPRSSPGINIVTTTHRLRGAGHEVDADAAVRSGRFYATAWVQILATPDRRHHCSCHPVERVFGVGLFDPARGGDPLLYQHLFWIYSHPAVYIMILPAMGVVSDIFPVFSRKTIFGYKTIAFSSLAIASVGSLVWGHHMFTSGRATWRASSSRCSPFWWPCRAPSRSSTGWRPCTRARSRGAPPLLYALSFIFLFSIGGLTGLIQGALATDVHLHDTYFVVAHFHYIIFGGMGFGFFAALHYWFPKMTGRMYNKRPAVGGLAGPVRRLQHPLLPHVHPGLAGHAAPLLRLPAAVRAPAAPLDGRLVDPGSRTRGDGRVAPARPAPRRSRGANPWGGATLEWTIPSPPPAENFEEIPTVTRGPYAFGPEEETSRDDH